MKTHRAKLHDRLQPELPKHISTYCPYDYDEYYDDYDNTYYDDSNWSNEYILVTTNEGQLEYYLTDNDTKYEEIHESWLIDYEFKVAKSAEQMFMDLYPELLI